MIHNRIKPNVLSASSWKAPFWFACSPPPPNATCNASQAIKQVGDAVGGEPDPRADLDGAAVGDVLGGGARVACGVLGGSAGAACGVLGGGAGAAGGTGHGAE